jgi:hypothetical protein
MKVKLSSLWRLAIALVLVLSFSLVMAAPAAATVNTVSVTIPAQKNVISIPAQYTIAFKPTIGLASGVNNIVITFPDDTTITDAAIADNKVTVNTVGVTAANVTVMERVATIVVPVNISASTTVTVVFLEEANVKNPSTAGSYTLKVHTDQEPTDVPSSPYSITNPPGPVDLWSAAVPSVYIKSYNTITAGIADAAEGETLKIHPGTYNEKNLRPGNDVDVTIQSTTGLLTGTGSAADTIISPSNLVAGSTDYVFAMAPGTGTADTLTVKGLTISSSTAFVGGLPAGGVGIRIPSSADANSVLTVNNCVISNFIWGVATEQAGSISVSGCTLSSNNHGIALWQPAALTLTGSTLNGNFGDGVLVEQDNSGKNILIYKNTFQDNNSTLLGGGDPLWPASGIAFTATTGKMNGTWSATNAISYNNFINNGYGIENRGGFAVPALYNWWGNMSGPSAGDVATTTAKGSGDKILDNDTAFEPWLTETYANTYVDNIRYYAALLPLDAGWNTLSVPITLKSSASSLTEIVSLGSYIVTTGTSQNYAGGYYWDGSWKSLTGDYEFAPGKAVYVKMLAPANFPVVYSGQISLPTVSLSTGWNLIGSMFGIDKTNGDYGIAATNDSDGMMKVNIALDSIKTNASVVVSPAVPGQTAPWGTVASDVNTEMIVGEGYWVYMKAADTLAGFEVTPLYFAFP